MLDILNRFTSNLKKALAAAINFSWQYKHLQVKPLHVYIGLAEQKGSIAAEVIKKTNIPVAELKRYLKQIEGSGQSAFPQLSPTVTQIIEKAALIAFNNQHIYIGTEHLLLSCLQNSDDHLKQIWQKYKVDTKSLISQLQNILKTNNRFSDMASLFANEEQTDKISEENITKKENSALGFFCTDLTNKKIQENIDPVIGRDKEVDRLIHILSRRNKNNPVLVGEAGVGKTAIAEGLAKRILEKKVPEILFDKKIYRLDLGLVVAGTMYRGEFEARFKQIIEELQKNKNIILFIDEIHTLIGAGGGGQAGGAMDAANILKPNLAKGEIRCIGATTSKEYEKYIESDAALERRFQPILIEELSNQETVEVIKGLRENYEKYHRVKINDDAIEAAVKLSSRYIQDKFLPDKAIDLIDEAAAKTKVDKPLEPLYLAIKQTEKKLSDIKKEKVAMVRKEKFEEALVLKQEEKVVEEKLNKLIKKQKNSPIAYAGEIKEKNIAEIISKITGVPTNELIAEEKKQLLNLNSTLDQKVTGQKEATKAVADFIRRSRAGLTAPNRPTGSFMFLGPSGVGKTELAKTLAKTLFGDKKSLIRIDMSEFSEKFNMSKLIGAPAGYVGYKEGSKLTDQVKRKPYSVVLFDEIEKAHPDVFNLLLQILEDGHITDAGGRQINFKNTIIIMTSNIGLKEFQEQAKIGFGEKNDNKNPQYEEVKEHVLKQLKNNFRPEFLNRIDKIVVFKPLNTEALIKIVDLELEKLKKRLKEQEISLNISKTALKFIAEESFKPDQGARAIRKNVQELIEAPIAEKILGDQLKKDQKLKIDLKNKKLTFSS